MSRVAVDETAAILARYGSPEKQRDYALMEADRGRRVAYEIAFAQYRAGGSRVVFDAAVTAGRAAWELRCGAIRADYEACTWTDGPR